MKRWCSRRYRWRKSRSKVDHWIFGQKSVGSVHARLHWCAGAGWTSDGGLDGELTLGLGAGALVATASTAGEGRFAALVTSLRFDPVWLATRLILPFVWPWPFFSLELVGFDSGSS